MKFPRNLSVIALVISLLPGNMVLAQGSKVVAPTQVVKSFYKFHFSHDMGFTKRNVLRRRRWLTPALIELLMNEFRREDQYAKTHPSESFVPYMDGDPFTNSQEYPTSFRVERAEVTGDKANVFVLFLWGGGNSRDSDKRNVTIQLERQGGTWLINNIVNKDNGDDLVVNLRREKYLP